MVCLTPPPSNEHFFGDFTDSIEQIPFTDEDVTELNDILGDDRENHLRSIDSEFLWRYKCQPKEDPVASFNKAIIVLVVTHAFAAALNAISR